ncbi:MAG: cyanophycinase [Pseudomonadales bacterium]|nr:cyanophycinase [Pseudomonadales bacterium]
MPSVGTEGVKRGYVIPIGGAEEKIQHQDILKRFVEISSGSEARIAIIPTASELEDTGDNYVKLFKELGVAEAVSLNITTRSEAQVDSTIEVLNQATGIFITGGNQLRLSTILGGTPVAQAIRKLNAHGTHVAGTSAGAAIIPEHMIAGGEPGGTPKQGSVSLCPGLGLTNRLIIDQHFRQRDRLGRLMSAVAYNPFLIGLGLDEDTAAFIDPEGVLHVEGSGAITIVDPSDLEYSGIDRASHGDTISLIGMRVHVLTKGCTYIPETGAAAFPA